MCSHTFTLCWLRKTSVTVEIFWLSFRVPFLRWSLQFVVSFPFPFPYFVSFENRESWENSCRYRLCQQLVKAIVLAESSNFFVFSTSTRFSMLHGSLLVSRLLSHCFVKFWSSSNWDSHPVSLCLSNKAR